jgi:thiamine-phosphate pyrophosphorylase
VQIREKNIGMDEFLALAKRVKTITDRHGIPLIVNDSLEVAELAGAAGLHIGKGDGDPAEARARLKPGKILGVSVTTPEEAIAAEKAGADYLGAGAVFRTATKDDADEVPPDALRKICDAVRIPVVAIGGIRESTIPLLSGTGIAGIAVVSALFDDPPRVRERAARLRLLAGEACAR